MELGRYLSADVFNTYINELKAFLSELQTIGDLDGITVSEVAAALPQVEWSTSPGSIRELFNNMENDLNTIDVETGNLWDNPYSKPAFQYQKKNGSLYPYVKRWFDWLNYNFKKYDEYFGNKYYVYTIENGQPEQLYDLSGEPIQVEIAS